MRPGLLEAVLLGFGCCGIGEPFLELVEGQGRLFWRKCIFKRAMREEERAWQGERGK